MKVWILIFFLAIDVIAQESKLNVAVMELVGNGIDENDMAGLSNRLRTELFQTGKFNVIERSQMDKIFREQGFQQTGCTNTECAVRLGKFIGVKYIVLGSIDKVSSMYAVNIRLVDVATGEILKSISNDCNTCSLIDLMKIVIKSSANELAGIKFKSKKSLKKFSGFASAGYALSVKNDFKNGHGPYIEAALVLKEKHAFSADFNFGALGYDQFVGGMISYSHVLNLADILLFKPGIGIGGIYYNNYSQYLGKDGAYIFGLKLPISVGYRYFFFKFETDIVFGDGANFLLKPSFEVKFPK